MVHMIRRIVNSQGKDSAFAMLSVDFINAFNLISRPVFLHEVQEHFPSIFAWVRYCYDGEAPHLWHGDFKMRSTRGVQQGDPLGPLLFCIALHLIAKKIEELSKDNPGEMLTQTWYMDDGVIIAKHSFLLKVLDLLRSEETVRVGLHLNLAPNKSELWWPVEPHNTVLEQYPAGLTKWFGQGTKVLQVPIGSPAFIKSTFMETVTNLKPLYDSLHDLNDAQTAFQLLRSCISVCKVRYFLNTIPPNYTRDAAILFDSMVESNLRRLIGGVLHKDVFKEFQLPVYPVNDQKVPTFGIGLTSAVTISEASFISSSSSCSNLVYDMCSSTDHQLPEDGDTKVAYESWCATINNNTSIPSWSEVISDSGIRSKRLTDISHAQLELAMQTGDRRTRAFRAMISQPGCKTWLRCRPSSGLKTALCNRTFIWWFKFFARVPLFADKMLCPRPGCQEPLDCYGDHLLHCKVGITRHKRHDAIRDLLASDLSRAARHPTTEPRLPALSQSRPDISALGSSGSTELFDVCIVHPLTNSRLEKCIADPAGPFLEKHSAKRSQHRSLLEELGSSYRLVTVPFATVGGMEKETESMLSKVAEAAAHRAQFDKEIATKILFNRYAALLVRANVECLTDGVLFEL